MEAQDNPTPQTTEPDSAAAKGGRRRWFVIGAPLALVVLLAGAGGYYWMHKDDTKVTVANSKNSAVLSEREQEEFEHEATGEVRCIGFVAQNLTVKKETRVYWQNSDDKDHEVVWSADSKDMPEAFGVPDGSVVPAGAGYAYSFHKAGTFRFRDASNP